jgi:hypothetical protein
MLPAKYKYHNVNSEVHFLIVNIGNDEKVLSAVKEREKNLIQCGYEKIIALRDMYSGDYDKRSRGEIDDNITRAFIESTNTTIRSMSDPSKIKMHFAIMELEAWFLGMYPVFERMNPALTVDYIRQNLEFDLGKIDPQNMFFKPEDEVGRIFGLVGWQYKKSEHDAEAICSRMDISDFTNIFENGKCASFRKFYDEILN